jgi:asparagine synthase (glutamine-hydrolysing)
VSWHTQRVCGIAGWIGPLKGPSDRERCIADMTASIRHRGPDDVGWWVDDHAALGMTRLSIIDLDGGRQPRTAGPWVVVFNGEIYNYRELRRVLEAEGATIDGAGDSEVVARAIETWGEQAFGRLDGMYAIAAYHRERDEALFARDRFGEKPLYLWQHGGATAFASEQRAFEPLGGGPRIDESSLAAYLALGFVPGPGSIWQGVHMLAPGSMARLRDGRLSFAPVVAAPEVSAPSTAEDPGASAVDRLDARLRQSVTARLVADVEVGVLLSGGIDSSLVAAHAAAVHPGVHSFSVAIDDPARDESAHARTVAERLGTTHHSIRVSDADALAVVEQLPEVYDEPFADSSAVPTLLLCRFVSDHVKVALSGDGGDEFFSGYRRHLLGGDPVPGRTMGLLGGLADRATHTWWVRPQEPWRDLQRRSVAPADRYLQQIGGMGPVWLRSAGAADGLGAWREKVRALAATGDPRWPEAADRELYLPGDILTKIDRASMSCGLEVRAPFLAPVVADWAIGLGPEVIGAPGAKALSRALLERHFGAELAHRPKQGFSVPLPAWLRGSLHPLVELACDGYLTSSGFLDRGAVHGLARALSRRFDRAAAPLWTIAMFELWHQRWAVGRRADVTAP